QLSVAVTPPSTLGTGAWQLPSALALVPAGQVTLGGVASTTVKVVVQVLLLLASSVAVTVMVCVPSPTRVPAVGLWLRVSDGSQLSVAVTPPSTLGTGAWQLPSALALVPAGQVTLGGVASTTLKVVVQVLLLFASSVAVTVMVWTPGPTSVPAAGLWLRVSVGSQLSVAVTPGRTFGTAAWQLPSPFALVPAGQVTLGGVESTTLKVVVQVLLLLASSVAVTVMVCAPSPTRVPAAGLWLRVSVGSQLSEAVTPGRTFGTAAWQLASALALVPAGQVTLGGVASTTVNAVVQVLLLLASSVAVTVIVWVPSPTRVPAAGL